MKVPTHPKDLTNSICDRIGNALKSRAEYLKDLTATPENISAQRAYLDAHDAIAQVRRLVTTELSVAETKELDDQFDSLSASTKRQLGLFDGTVNP